MTVMSAPTGWGYTTAHASCSACGWSYLLPSDALPGDGSRALRCPHCFAVELSFVPEPQGGLAEKLAYTSPPELVLPFSLSPERLSQAIATFARGIPFAPPDLNPQALAGRMKRVYLPQWLVDASLRATWQAEVGFNYEVVSHQDRYSDSAGGWRSQEVKETRIRWEPRLGQLQRVFPNLTAPALETHARLRGLVGDFDTSTAQPYQSQMASTSFVRLPDRSPEDAWPDVLPGLQAAAALPCQLACSADHQRDFRWQPEVTGRNWTLLLRPLYTTYYLDDQNQPQAVLINGQTAQTSGSRRSSMKRAQRTALIILSIAVVLFAISAILALAGIAVPPLLPLGGVGVLIAVLVALGAVIPLALVWQYNRSQPRASQSLKQFAGSD